MIKKTFNPCVACGHKKIRGMHRVVYWTPKDGKKVRIFFCYPFCDACGECTEASTEIRNDRNLFFSVRHFYVMKIWNKANPLTLRSK